MSRVWYEVISPKQLHDQFGVYHGIYLGCPSAAIFDCARMLF